MLPAVCTWSKFILLSRLSFTVLLIAVFNLLIPEAAGFASEELIGEVALINNVQTIEIDSKQRN